MHRSFDGKNRLLFSYTAPIARGAATDGYLVLSLQLDTFVSAIRARLLTPPEVLSLVTRERTTNQEILDTAPTTHFSAAQRLLASLPRVLTEWLVPPNVGSRIAGPSGSGAICALQLKTPAPGILNCPPTGC